MGISNVAFSSWNRDLFLLYRGERGTIVLRNLLGDFPLDAYFRARQAGPRRASLYPAPNHCPPPSEYQATQQDNFVRSHGSHLALQIAHREISNK